MKMLRWFVAIAMVGGLSGIAKANGFQMVVIDPSPQYVTPIYNNSFSFSFSSCISPEQVPAGSGYVGCFTGVNLTGATLTSLELLIPVFSYQGQPETVGCSLFGAGLDIFKTVTCGTTADGKNFFLDFSDGSIPDGNVVDCDNDGDSGDPNEYLEGCSNTSFFTIAETGVPVDSFPTNLSAVANASAPEPGSFWLLATGLLSGGLFLSDRRRRSANPSQG
jgi:hypothetical protein